MQHSGFFNAIMQNGLPDKTYNANDYSDNLAVVISNGVLRSDADDLRVTADGMAVSVAEGRAWIDGRYYYNDSVYDFPSVTAPTGGGRIDRVMLRLNKNVDLRDETERKISLVYVQGTASAEPVAPSPVRADGIYDLVLANVNVPASASSVTVEDMRSVDGLCGWIYSNTRGYIFKCYTWEKTLTSETSTVQFDIPQYTSDNGFIEVNVNGILESENTDFSQVGNVLTFTGTLIAGTVVTVKYYKAIDAQGIESVSGEITELQQQVSALDGVSRYTYFCTGNDDNISISQIAQAFLTGSYSENDVTESAKKFLSAIGGNTYLASLASDAQIGIDVCGKCGVTTAYLGSGSAAVPFRWFSLGRNLSSKRIIFDFSKCDKVNVACAGSTSNVILSGENMDVRGLNIKASSSATSCNIEMTSGITNSGRLNFSDCRFEIQTTGTAIIARHGVYSNCYAYIVSEAGTAYCFNPNNSGLLRLNGGEFYAYGRTSSGIGSAIVHVSASDSDAVLLAYNIQCPMLTKTAYTQAYLSVANAGNVLINGVVTSLTSIGEYNQITGLVNKNKV